MDNQYASEPLLENFESDDFLKKHPSAPFLNVQTIHPRIIEYTFMSEDKYQRLYETHWARALFIILLLSVVIGSLLSWLESN